ncbi:hypothetical protein [Actinokineospora iranica]|uniref:Uncharacterized protein n=1 Tax=Actinokineospora iranica TaxID=1271860 RepID=A0A1G6P3E6_9PSEU|nr:hypothetical protein [Actinokineospora iranica]SDC73947.1 hypothetical protein SAMN05216174_10468 [Actinokineospora iranica]
MSTAISDKAIPVPSGRNTTPPRASVVVGAFAATPVGHPVLTAAARLATQHRLRAQSHRLVCDPHADDHVVAAAARSVDAARAVLIDWIDVWSGRRRLPRYQTPTGPAVTA